MWKIISKSCFNALFIRYIYMKVRVYSFLVCLAATEFRLLDIYRGWCWQINRECLLQLLSFKWENLSSRQCSMPLKLFGSPLAQRLGGILTFWPVPSSHSPSLSLSEPPIQKKPSAEWTDNYTSDLGWYVSKSRYSRKVEYFCHSHYVLFHSLQSHWFSGTKFC